MEKMKDMQASYWIKRLGMTPHPEGGYYKEEYRPEYWKPIDGLPIGKRVLTTIYYLLEKDDFSAFHRIKSPESWFFHKGEPLLIYSFEEGTLVCRELSDQESGTLQVTIEPGIWFAARLKEAQGFALVSCAVAPGFEYPDFELADEDVLLSEYPDHREMILSLI
ncbi:cupin domain-containing protein [Parabacteroides acidifaciens]|uniref:Cupin domain-containing protein n=1 Tax=Parabacteroides acidifaciens TaxID=2290935 RepID=A0A3D8HCF1_9BACT|nr:cupin domain-containing protein [Parabacteroides acidifaciens]MBC8603087.1 cupin domain-containing protein [Parabacteroides acidifaciens]RDU48207.1 cupin domain-containing protein [Parabacteroides acidifaciens]